MSTELPSGYTFGKVVGQAIRAVGDQPEDLDFYPEAQPITGKKCVSFAPKVAQVVTPDNGVATMVLQDKIECDMNENGQLIRNGEDPGEIGVWLYTGVWTVSFTGVMNGIKSFDILVTEFHADDPLDLFANMATPIPPSDPVTTLVVPSGGSEDMVLSWIDGRLQWVNRMDFPDGEYLVQAQQASQTAVDAKNVSVSSKNDSVAAKNDAVQAKNDAQTFAANFNTWFLRGNGFPLGVITPASAGVQYVDLAATCGARIWISTGTTSSSCQVVNGDTGWREISSLLINGWTADSLRIRRITSAATLLGINLSGLSSTSNDMTPAISGFSLDLPIYGYAHLAPTRGTSDTTLAAVAFWSNWSEVRLRMTGSAVTPGSNRLIQWSAGSSLWPTTLPGTPA